MRKPFRIGITGGIGSGKTTICKVFEILGIPVFYSDDVSRSLLANDPEIRQKVILLFGEEAFPHGKLNKAFIASKVFENEELLLKLNQILHPAVANEFEKWCSSKTSAYIIKEAAIIFESGSNKWLDWVIVVSAPEELRIKRVMERDHVPDSLVRSRINRQWTDAQREAMASQILFNDEKHAVLPEVLKIHERYSHS